MQAVIRALETDHWIAPIQKLQEAQGRTICIQWASVEKKQNYHPI